MAERRGMSKENLVRTSTKPIVENAQFVTINRKQIERLASEWKAKDAKPPKWPKEAHLETDNVEQMLTYLITLDTLNFCFWHSEPEKRWGIMYEGKRYNGYYALALALKKFFIDTPRKATFQWMRSMKFEDFKAMLGGTGELLLLKERWNTLREASVAIEANCNPLAQIFNWDGDAIKTAVCIASINSFNDVEWLNNKCIWFLKRAQLLISDIYGAFGGRGPGAFKNMEELTAFADYKLPQLLEHEGILVYDAALRERIRRQKLIFPSSREEIEIRAAAIWAVEYLRDALTRLGKNFRAFEIDWMLWNESQTTNMSLPYHRCETIYY